ncbi:alpha/beta fold hydrolase [Gordonia sp. HNM0687]|uniref:Alpha/beta fold hydrolase n=1 Tax=Gordonia mangrovi TaxID=2665643 RepID=A0A6L7GRD3_9ACTN|nr:alpha/beta hydrolase [Gordonia mangrovi]MXP22456.1 alpha/beta fold hydrolase [Gordonia mangrovi]UVF77668.1 alpha/beta hydrolase [Gordonia mangrovi]
MTASSSAARAGEPAATWQPDHLLDRYEVLTLPLGPDPDGEDPITATLVRKAGPEPAVNGAVLYVHGFTDYFFHEPLADYFHERGYAFYALDLRKCGRSLQPQHTAHFATDLRRYDEELGHALDVVAAETAAGGGPERVIVAAHSTGGIITPLWLDRLRSTSPDLHDKVCGLLLNSPWFDLQGSPILRTPPVSLLLRALAAVRPKAVLPQELSDGYGRSIHETTGGEWAYDLALKPLGGFPVTFGFLNAVRRGQARLHRGVDVGVPSLVLRSDKTLFDRSRPGSVDDADVVLDVRHMSRWSGYLGDRVTVVPIADARHDVFLSVRHAREHAYREIDSWLQGTLGGATDVATSAQSAATTDPA